MPYDTTVRVTSMVPWLEKLKFHESVEVKIKPRVTKVQDVMEEIGIKLASQGALLVIINGHACTLIQVLEGGEEIQLFSAVSGG